MNNEPAHAADDDIDALMRDGRRVADAVAQAQREAARQHLLLGQPIVLRRDGRVVELWPSDPEAAAILASGR